jgi:Rrf2 family protein
MPENRQFSIAVHVMATLGYNKGPVTSGTIAQSVNTSPSFVRRVMAKLSRAGLVETSTGKTGSATLARPAEKISLLEIYKAVEAPRAFAIHDYPEQKVCPVSCNIKASLGKVLEKAQQRFECGLEEMNLADVIADLTR